MFQYVNMSKDVLSVPNCIYKVPIYSTYGFTVNQTDYNLCTIYNYTLCMKKNISKIVVYWALIQYKDDILPV